MKSKTGILLVNLGTPNSPSNSDVYKYLIEFLTDYRVIDFSWLKRNLLVRGIIVPARYKQSAKTYREIWDAERGSPLLYHTQDLVQKVQTQLGDQYVVEFAMRYQQPSIENGLLKLKNANVSKIVVLPLFPQYSSACNGSVIQKIFELTATWNVIPSIEIIHQFYNFPTFIDAIVARVTQHVLEDFDHILFSYHGLPARHLIRTANNQTHNCENENCRYQLTENNQHCYLAQCYETTRLIVAQLQLSTDKYSTSFQSRLGKEVWLEPYTVERLPQLAREGKKKILILSPAFVADCLETLFEIKVEYQELFQEHGGEQITLVESLNAEPKWVYAVCKIVQQNSIKNSQ